MSVYKTLKDHVYDYISDKINDGSLKPSERINENNISEDLQVSRTPVREALLQLASEGYLEKLPRRGFTVRELKQERVEQIYVVIGCLEGLAAKLSLAHITDEHVDKMKEFVKSMDKALENRNYSEYYKLQTKFHDVYISASGNDELTKLLNELKRSFIRQTYYTNGGNGDEFYEALLNTHEEHKVIVKLFKEKNGDKLEDYIKDVHWGIKYARYDSI